MSEESKELGWSDYIGKRVLVRETASSSRSEFDYTVVEVSPSGTRVKFMNSMGRMFWTDYNQYTPVEVLS